MDNEFCIFLPPKITLLPKFRELIVVVAFKEILEAGNVRRIRQQKCRRAEIFIVL